MSTVDYIIDVSLSTNYYAKTSLVYLCNLQKKNSSGRLVSHSTRTRYAKQERELVRWLSIQSISNFGMITGQDNTSSEQYLIADKTFGSDNLELGEDDIDEEVRADEEDEMDEEDEEGETEKEKEAEREAAEDLGKDTCDLVQCALLIDI